MAVRIKDVAITKDYSMWEDVKDKFESWDEVADLNTWGSVYAYADSGNKLLVGQKYIVTIVAEDVTWGTIKTDFQSWNSVKNNTTNWNSLLNYK